DEDELCNTLPALELCYSMTQRFLDEHHHKTPEPTPAEVEMCSSPHRRDQLPTGRSSVLVSHLGKISVFERLFENLSLFSKLKCVEVRDFGETIEWQEAKLKQNSTILINSIVLSKYGQQRIPTPY
ncbi:hypothetical protein U1Q18_048939, partial [Sarracenia purpurea var. burkii]